jgi:hypothetical protein
MREDARMSAVLDHDHSYYEARNSGDPDRVAAHFLDDVVQYYTRLGPHEGARVIAERRLDRGTEWFEFRGARIDHRGRGHTMLEEAD